MPTPGPRRQAVETWVAHGIEAAMNRWNGIEQ